MSLGYEETTLTPIKVARSSGYLDWSSQPSIFKHYPDFLFRYKFGENPELQAVELSRQITSTKTIANKPYYQLNTPSAGNLHPVELYVQVRGIKGVLSGIYHVDAGAHEFVLVQEISEDGLEALVGIDKSLHGMIFIVTTVPYRAQWKYNERALRYCFLDVGHQIAALDTALKTQQHSMTILSDFDKKRLHQFMGLKEEYICAVSYLGEIKKKTIKPLQTKLMYVNPTNYSELDENLIKLFDENYLYNSPLFEIDSDVTNKVIVNRRSARAFDLESFFSQQTMRHFLEYLYGVESEINTYAIVLNKTSFVPGVYFRGELIKEGDFSKEMSGFLVDQKFIMNGDIVVIYTAREFSENLLMLAGVQMHNLYMEVERKGFGCSGIGAFYDLKIQKFLNSNDFILYVGVVGVRKS